MRKFDDDFILRLQNQDHIAFNEFYLKSVDIFFRYIKTHYFVSDQDCHDVISTFYVKYREAVKNFDIEQSFHAYVWTIFKNTLKDYFKKMSDMPFSVLEDKESGIQFDEQLDWGEDLMALLEQDFQFEQIEQAIQKLDSLSKDIIFLRFIEERSTKEISDILQLSDDNVRKRLSRAIQSLKKLLTTK